MISDFERTVFFLVMLIITITIGMPDNIFATLSQLANPVTLSGSENESAMNNVAPVQVSTPNLVTQFCKVYSEFEVQVCIPRSWYMTKEVYGNLTHPSYSDLNSSLLIEFEPCLARESCFQRHISNDMNPLIPSDTRTKAAGHPFILNYTIHEIANNSITSRADYLTHYMQKIINDASANNESNILQISPSLLDGMESVKISYEAPYCPSTTKGSESVSDVRAPGATEGQDIVAEVQNANTASNLTLSERILAASERILTAADTGPCDNRLITRQLAVGEDYVYEVVYTLPSSVSFSPLRFGIEEIINNTGFSQPFKVPLWSFERSLPSSIAK